MELIEQYIQLLTIKRYCPTTIKTYTNALRQFLNAFPTRNPEAINLLEIEGVINSQVTHNNISASYQKQLGL